MYLLSEDKHNSTAFTNEALYQNACMAIDAPACYALHYSLGPPGFDWAKLKEPVRLNCRDETLQLLSTPQVRNGLER